MELFIPESTYDASSTRSFSVSADISESMCPRDEAGSRGPNSTMDDSGQESDHFEADQTWHVPVRTRSCRKRLRWKSFYRDHQPSFRSRNVQLSNLSAGQASDAFKRNKFRKNIGYDAPQDCDAPAHVIYGKIQHDKK